MVKVKNNKDGYVVTGGNYTLTYSKENPYYVNLKFKNKIGASLYVASGCDGVESVDKMLKLSAPSVKTAKNGKVTVSFKGTSTIWEKKVYTFECRENRVLYSYQVEGTGDIDTAWFFEGFIKDDPALESHGYPWFCGNSRQVGYKRPYKHFARSSVPSFDLLFTPSINGSDTRYQMYYENAALRVDGSRTFLGGDWLTSPPPFCYLLGNRAKNKWVTMGLCVKDGENNFQGYRYYGGEGFGMALDYKGYTKVDGKWKSPTILFEQTTNEYKGLEDYVSFLYSDKFRKKTKTKEFAWWKRPIFCGWGEQVFLSDRWTKFLKGRTDFEVDIPALCTQKLYTELIERLEKEGIDPGTIIIDYRWFIVENEFVVDTTQWPDMKGFIRDQHDKGRHVILWASPFSHAQAALGKTVPKSECITAQIEPDLTKAQMNMDIHNPSELVPDFHTDVLYPAVEGKKQILNKSEGSKKWNPIFVDPTNPKYEKRLRKLVRSVISPEGLDADGFKFDYTHFLPQERGVKMHTPMWGVELLKKLLYIYSDEAKKVKEDALMITHTFNPYFSDVVGMLRLQDLYTDRKSVVDLMTHRAKIANIACPDALIDTDNHPLVSRDAWDEYARKQPSIGVPALYYVSAIETTREKLEKKHFQMIKETWEEYEASLK